MTPEESKALYEEFCADEIIDLGENYATVQAMSTPEESKAFYEEFCADQIAKLDRNYAVLRATHGRVSLPTDQKVLLSLQELVIKFPGSRTAENLRADIREELRIGGHSRAVLQLALLYV